MSFIGTVSNGKVILPPDANLADGTQVRVEPVEKPADRDDLTETLERIAGKIHGLPPDLAKNHDHYLYGTPKR